MPLDARGHARPAESRGMREASDLAAPDNVISGPFYHGTKADLKPGDLISPGYRSNYGHAERTSPRVYMTATLSPLGAELAIESCVAAEPATRARSAHRYRAEIRRRLAGLLLGEEAARKVDREISHAK